MGVRRRNEKEELRAAMWVQRNFFFARSGSVRAAFFLCTKFILKTKTSGATRARSLCFIRSRSFLKEEFNAHRKLLQFSFARRTGHVFRKEPAWIAAQRSPCSEVATLNQRKTVDSRF